MNDPRSSKHLLLLATSFAVISALCCPLNARAADGKLALGEATLTLTNKPKFKLQIHRDGRVVVKNKPMGKLSADGRFTARNGKAFARLNADGSIEALGKKLPLSVSAQGDLKKQDGTTSSFNSAGEFPMSRKKGGAKLITKGCDGAMRRTCIFVMTMLFFTRPTR